MQRLVRYVRSKVGTSWIVAEPYCGLAIAAHAVKATAVSDALAQVLRAGGGTVLVFSEQGLLESTHPVKPAVSAKSRLQHWRRRSVDGLSAVTG